MLTALLLAVTLVLPAAAQEDPPVLVGGRPAAGVFQAVTPASVGGVLLSIGPSDPFPAPYDSLLFQGELPDAGASFQAAREANGSWSAWKTAVLSRRGDGRFWARVDFPGRGTGRLRVRALAKPGSTGAPVTVYSMQVFTRGPERPAPGPSGSGPEGAAPPLPVIERSAWGAKPPKEPYTPDVPVKVTQHHSAGRQTHSLAESEAELRFIQDFHQNGRGWNDIAYHFLIDADGRIFRGRPVDVVGSHTLDDNTGNVGICLLGNHHPPANDPVTPAELASIVRVGRWLQARYGITPDKYLGHRDRNPGHTDCPGDGLYALLPRIRAMWEGTPSLASRLGDWLERVRARAAAF
ncbi:MAG: N-acetylmuramoyl-L-alanine amidase [Elusimicrobia bacterium]|nr:N-acetylmuramoyl-L-alanine amidase [Elusimicrobiota bacterium]